MDTAQQLRCEIKMSLRNIPQRHDALHAKTVAAGPPGLHAVGSRVRTCAAAVVGYTLAATSPNLSLVAAVSPTRAETQWCLMRRQPKRAAAARCDAHGACAWPCLMLNSACAPVQCGKDVCP
eukprot:364640-Chlamydomonas_euryale.AAC.2